MNKELKTVLTALLLAAPLTIMLLYAGDDDYSENYGNPEFYNESPLELNEDDENHPDNLFNSFKPINPVRLT